MVRLGKCEKGQETRTGRKNFPCNEIEIVQVIWGPEKTEVSGATLVGSTIGETGVFLFRSSLAMVRSKYDGNEYIYCWKAIQFRNESDRVISNVLFSIFSVFQV